MGRVVKMSYLNLQNALYKLMWPLKWISPWKSSYYPFNGHTSKYICAYYSKMMTTYQKLILALGTAAIFCSGPSELFIPALLITV